MARRRLALPPAPRVLPELTGLTLAAANGPVEHSAVRACYGENQHFIR